jgi:hypothetical protein
MPNAGRPFFPGYCALRERPSRRTLTHLGARGG